MNQKVIDKLGLKEIGTVQFGNGFVQGIKLYQYKDDYHCAACDPSGNKLDDKILIWQKNHIRNHTYVTIEFILYSSIELQVLLNTWESK